MKFLTLAFLAFLLIPACKAETGGVTQPLTIESADGKTNHHFNIEIVDTPAKRTIGMMFRKSMEDDFGMLFVFDEDVEKERSFWMKNTLIPLDIVFIRRDGTIAHIHANAIPKDLTSIPSTVPVLSVLEIKGGQAARLGIKPGDKVHHTIFAPALADKPPIH